MKRSSKQAGFTMVEMLAVVAVMAVLVALTIPNGIFARTAGEEAVTKATAASLELGMATLLTREGARGEQAWEQAYAADPSVHNMWLLLQTEGCFPASTSFTTVTNSLAGYNLQFPPRLNGKVQVTRATDNAIIYP